MAPNGNSTGRSVFRPGLMFNGVKIFSATMMADRQMLGAKCTDWMQNNPHKQVIEIVVTQSSDEAFHCITLTVYYHEDLVQ
jgi:hypothetical protein